MAAQPRRLPVEHAAHVEGRPGAGKKLAWPRPHPTARWYLRFCCLRLATHPVYRATPAGRLRSRIGELFDARVARQPVPASLGNAMSTSLSSLTSLLPAASVIITGVIVGVLLARVDNRAEERLDP